MSQCPRLFFSLFFLMKANPLKLFDWGSWSEISSPFTHRLRRPFRRRTCCRSRGFDFFFFPLFLPISPFDKRGKEEAEEEAEAGEKILIECSPPDNEFSTPFKCICRMLEWFITADSEVWQWTSEMSDAIFLLISFPWSSLSPWPVYLY